MGNRIVSLLLAALVRKITKHSIPRPILPVRSIHRDFEKNFIKTEVVSYPDLIEAGSMQSARESGKWRLEGKEYLFMDGDVVLFKCNA